MTSNGWHRKDPSTAAEQARRATYASAEHRQQVALVKQLVASGKARCWRCGCALPPGSKAHAGHDDNDRSIYRGPECPKCNLQAAARKGARIANAKRRRSRAATPPPPPKNRRRLIW